MKRTKLTVKLPTRHCGYADCAHMDSGTMNDSAKGQLISR